MADAPKLAFEVTLNGKPVVQQTLSLEDMHLIQDEKVFAALAAEKMLLAWAPNLIQAVRAGVADARATAAVPSPKEETVLDDRRSD